MTQPSNTVSGKAQANPISVQLFDAFGNVATNSAVQVSIVPVSATPGIKLSGQTTATPQSGIVQFPSLIVTGYGIGLSLQARSGSVAGNSNTFNSILLSSILPVVVVPGEIYGPHPNGSAVESYVKGVYRTLLGRDSDPDGLSFWMDKINSGTPRTAIIESFWNSPENRGREVDAYYQAYLGRNADPQGHDFWVNKLQTGSDETLIVKSFLLSPESLGAPDALFIQRLYQGALGRSAADAEISFWVGQLGSGATRQQVTDSFIFSTEAAGVAMDSYYGAYLERRPDPPGRAFWVNKISTQQGSYSTVAKALLASDEFFANAGKFVP
jgi:hypothetical protein